MGAGGGRPPRRDGGPGSRRLSLALSGRRPASPSEVPIKQLTESSIAPYLHALCQGGLGMDVLDVDEPTGTVLPQLLLAHSREK